jgi:shikimate 5-dehydrogenase
MNGDLMLLYQTAAAFELWTGRQVPMEMLAAKLDEVRSAASTEPAAAEG